MASTKELTKARKVLDNIQGHREKLVTSYEEATAQVSARASEFSAAVVEGLKLDKLTDGFVKTEAQRDALASALDLAQTEEQKAQCAYNEAAQRDALAEATKTWITARRLMVGELASLFDVMTAHREKLESLQREMDRQRGTHDLMFFMNAVGSGALLLYRCENDFRLFMKYLDNHAEQMPDEPR